ncbi:hypothetical protein BVH03_17585 [Pseudomonas sp. PA15(2017)]|uniref:Arc family DNA-binding protein n=1 Tax=Pseudomonas sp. PA15(2017) TaxID=1932111 RepID=UPI00095ABFEB|nr:Arc family DNA-binding protein [Pseudomonas sp. PA15(2017)]OLU25468.1 hypothetical protein BVH03_17585 [Pseudomonas sp. PA15(2017)]
MSHQQVQRKGRIDKPKYLVRLPDGMRERISKKAKTAQRSMNMEIIHRLSCSFEAEDDIRRLEAALDSALELNRFLRKELAQHQPSMFQEQGALV